MNEPNSHLPHLVVLGGGLAGLSVARECLRRGGCRVTVLEKAERPGGMAISLCTGGATADLGPHRIYSTMPEMRQWFRETLGGRMFVVRRSSRMFFHKQYLRYPPAPFELLGAIGPLVAGRFGAGWAWSKARATCGGLPPDSFAAVMERAFGRPVCEALVFPFARKLWKREPDRISADAARARATMGGLLRLIRRILGPREKEGRESSLRKFHYLHGGIEGLARQLADDLRHAGGKITCGADVQKLSIENDAITSIEFRDTRNNQNKSLDADFVFSTIPLPQLVGGLARGRLGGNSLVDAAQGLEFVNIILAYAVIRRPRLSADHWLYFPEAEPRINRAYEAKNFDPSMAPEDRTVLCIEITTRPGDPEWDRDDEKLANDLIGRIASTGLFDANEVQETHVHRIENGYPVYGLDYRPKLLRIWKALGEVRNLVPLGRHGLFQHNNMDHTIHTGLRAAACWKERNDPVAAWYGEEMPTFQDFKIVD